MLLGPTEFELLHLFLSEWPVLWDKSVLGQELVSKHRPGWGSVLSRLQSRTAGPGTCKGSRCSGGKRTCPTSQCQARSPLSPETTPASLLLLHGGLFDAAFDGQAAKEHWTGRQDSQLAV
jgi:hypothetical protein